jgi:hypothetical protein
MGKADFPYRYGDIVEQVYENPKTGTVRVWLMFVRRAGTIYGEHSGQFMVLDGNPPWLNTYPLDNDSFKRVIRDE